MITVQRAWTRLRRVLANPPPDPAASTVDIDRDAHEIFDQVRGYTMTNLLRVSALVRAVEYIVHRNVPGAFVECGVWRGGSVLAMLLKLLRMGLTDRDIYLYDTFEGMTQPGNRDLSPFEQPALTTWQRARRAGLRPWHEFFNPAHFTLDQVRSTLLATGYPASRLHFVQGPVSETIPATAASSIALLRLDTDWFDSTWHELIHLYPRLSPCGVLIVDDYGHWDGCRQAVDKYFGSGHASPVLLSRIDYAARLAIKV